MKGVATRFAPSPSGRLHLGNARAAIINWLFARKSGGSFMLRLDDTDRERSRPEFARAIEEDLGWLGLTWDRFARQSDRLAHYERAAQVLKSQGRLYPCFETAEELDLKRKLAQARGRPPLYDRAALSLSEAEITRRLAAGETPHWRFKLDHAPISWPDLIRGVQEFHGAHLSDPVVIRADGMPLYTFSSVVDDGELAISHIIRAEDHVTNTAPQIQLFAALGYEIPAFAHFSLIVGAGGEALSKRFSSESLAAFREDGIETMAINSLLATLGTSDAIEPRLSLDELVGDFDLGKFGRAPPHFDPEDLRVLNARLLHVTPYERVADRLAAGAGRDFWEAVRPNLERLTDAELWWRICREPLMPVIDADDAAFLAAAATHLPPEPLDGSSWDRLVAALKIATGRKGKALFMPLRRALTARDHGPELKALLPLIGRARAEGRLRGEVV
ncbi:MAG TPA: glutamate--tRNA ligase [Stellaceae bacterium]|nr:glutamate--tRNA ligase [Stellaceae bacterium]